MGGENSIQRTSEACEAEEIERLNKHRGFGHLLLMQSLDDNVYKIRPDPPEDIVA